MGRKATTEDGRPMTGAARKKQYDNRKQLLQVRQGKEPFIGPPTKLRTRIDVYLTKEERTKFAEIADKEGLSIREIVGHLLQAYADDDDDDDEEETISDELPAVGDSAWRRLGLDLIDMLNSSRTADTLFLVELSRLIKDFAAQNPVER